MLAPVSSHLFSFETSAFPLFILRVCNIASFAAALSAVGHTVLDVILLKTEHRSHTNIKFTASWLDIRLQLFPLCTFPSGVLCASVETSVIDGVSLT